MFFILRILRVDAELFILSKGLSGQQWLAVLIKHSLVAARRVEFQEYITNSGGKSQSAIEIACGRRV